MENINFFELKFKSLGENEAFARHVVGNFILRLNPTIEELEDVKTSVSEAVTNAIVHGYNSNNEGDIILKCSISSNIVEIIVEDNGVGIDDIDKALEPFYTSKPEMDRSGMGFTLMKSFMNTLLVESSKNKGVKVVMTKVIGKVEDNVRA